MGNELTVAGAEELHAQMDYAKAVAHSDIVPDAYRGKPANILIAMGFGQSMGLSPAESMYRINVIKGKPTMGAELIAAQVRKAGHKLRIRKDEANMSVTAIIVRSDDPDYPFTATRDQAWAQQMGLTGKDNYKKQPMTMLTWRAITAVAREACPEALFGVAYTPDEMHDFDKTTAVSQQHARRANLTRTIPTKTAQQQEDSDVEVQVVDESAGEAVTLQQQAVSLANQLNYDNGAIPELFSSILGREVSKPTDINDDEWRKIIKELQQMLDDYDHDGNVDAVVEDGE